jgi:hypothetical protein
MRFNQRLRHVGGVALVLVLALADNAEAAPAAAPAASGSATADTSPGKTRAMSPGAAAAKHPTVHRVVTYLGRDFSVPATWQVSDLTAQPTTCVRFDVHAVYLGRPGAQQRCSNEPAGRRTGALLIQPDPTRSADGVIGADLSAFHEISVRVPGLAITASYGDEADRSAILEALATAGLPPPVVHAGPWMFTRNSQPVDIARGTTMVTGLGFDTCTAPTAAQMQAWTGSPYTSIGIYIGGSERACSQPNLTRAWVADRAASGWHFMPLYVGWQAAWDSLTDNAPAVLGARSADDAVAQARRLGLGIGSLIYYDMEAYSTRAQGIAAMAFLSAWTAELHARQYRSAVYSSADAGIADLVANRGMMTEPDAVAIGQWNGKPDPDLRATPTDAWPFQRVHQFIGNATATYGGVTLNLDEDYLWVNIPPLPSLRVQSAPPGVARGSGQSSASLRPRGARVAIPADRSSISPSLRSHRPHDPTGSPIP